MNTGVESDYENDLSFVMNDGCVDEELDDPLYELGTVRGVRIEEADGLSSTQLEMAQQLVRDIEIFKSESHLYDGEMVRKGTSRGLGRADNTVEWVQYLSEDDEGLLICREDEREWLEFNSMEELGERGISVPSERFLPYSTASDYSAVRATPSDTTESNESLFSPARALGYDGVPEWDLEAARISKSGPRDSANWMEIAKLDLEQSDLTARAETGTYLPEKL